MTIADNSSKRRKVGVEDNERLQRERNYMIRKSLKTPCTICGSNQHKAITQETPGDQSTIEYECPAALEEKWDPDLHHSVYRKNIQVCPYKFAEMFNFQKEQ